MHEVLSPEFFLMWLIAKWFNAPQGDQHTLRIVLKWAVNRYLNGRLDS
jgi:hypothetical protein